MKNKLTVKETSLLRVLEEVQDWMGDAFHDHWVDGGHVTRPVCGLCGSCTASGEHDWNCPAPRIIAVINKVKGEEI